MVTWNNGSAPKTGSSATDRQSSSPTNWMMDWMEHCGADLWCDENCAARRNVLGESRHCSKNEGPAEPLAYSGVDHEALHDEFLESLLFEQSQKEDESSLRTSQTDSMSLTSGSMDSSAASIVSTSEGSEVELPRKRPRPVKLPRKKTPPRVRTKQVAPAPLPPPPVRDNSSSSRRPMTVNLKELSKESFPHPSSYLLPHCRMQKDKGKGEPVGSVICAKGGAATLDKLRAKMQLLVEVAFGDSRTPATMKRLKAKVYERCENFTETRSLIELRMGFLSMTYGVLLRWDTSKAKISLVVLRKMCHDSFYPVRPRMVASPLNTSNGSSSAVGNDAILGKADGTEVSLIEPPYCVPRPEQFEPTQLQISVLYATGLSRRSNWTAQLTYEDCIENILLTWDSELGYLVPKLGAPLQVTPNDLSSCLEIRLFEHRLRRRNQRRLVSSMKVPLSNLRPQPSEGGKPSRMKIPCQDDHDASISIDMLYRSDYHHWLAKELEARRREEEAQAQQGFWRKRSTFVVEEEEDENQDPWEWICFVC